MSTGMNERPDRAVGHHDRPGREVDQHDGEPVGRESILQREQDEHGGIKLGSAFFGWLTATGAVVLMLTVLSGIGTVIGQATETSIDQATTSATDNPSMTRLIGAIVGLVIVLIAYYCGGYVAGRMARFNGLKQGLAVWLWAVIIAVVLAGISLLADEQFNLMAQLDSLPQIPVDQGSLSTSGLIAAAAVAVVSLVGALLGGLAGMRFHRKVDRTGLGH